MSEAPASPPFRQTWRALAVILIATLIPAAAEALLIRGSAALYAELAKPAFAPPGWVFPAVWSVLYILMGVSLWLTLRTPGRRAAVIARYAVQLAVNLAWPVLFFVLRAYGLAFLWLLLLLALITLLMDRTFRAAPSAGWLLVPYAAWVAFAGLLNFMIAQMNP